MDQLVSTISSTVALSVCASRLEAATQLEGVVWHHEPPVRGMHTCMERAALKCPVVDLKSRAAARSSARPKTCSNFGPHPVLCLRAA